MSATLSTKEETEVLVKAMRRSKESDGWEVTDDISAVPENVGHYSLYDGFDMRGCGVTWNMRKSLEDSAWFRGLTHGIFLWQPDRDGSAALWLQGQIKCKHCGAVMDIEERDEHLANEHDIELEEWGCRCED